MTGRGAYAKEAPCLCRCFIALTADCLNYPNETWSSPSLAPSVPRPTSGTRVRASARPDKLQPGRLNAQIASTGFNTKHVTSSETFAYRLVLHGVKANQILQDMRIASACIFCRAPCRFRHGDACVAVQERRFPHFGWLLNGLSN